MAAWGNGVPAVVVTAKDGGHHGTTTNISMVGGKFSYSKKDNPETWKKVVGYIMDDETYATHYAILGYGKRESFSNDIARTFDAFARRFLER